MQPIDARLAAFREQLDNLDAPEDAATATLASATDWNAAKASGDITALRSMVGKAFPRGIGILPATSRGRASPTFGPLRLGPLTCQRGSRRAPEAVG